MSLDFINQLQEKINYYVEMIKEYYEESSKEEHIAQYAFIFGFLLFIIGLFLL